MRAALEAVADYLSKYGALEESKAIIDVMEKMGWSVAANSTLRWRSLIAVMKQELSAKDEPVDYVFLFERLIQLILVERFAAAFEDYDDELFKLESDGLCHAEGIYEICLLIQDKLFTKKDDSLMLATFLDSFTQIFDEDEPRASWETFYQKHRINEVSFRRDMKRALWQIEKSTIGSTAIEEKFPNSNSSTQKEKVVIPRKLLEQKFQGDPDEWRNLWNDLSVVHSVAVADEPSNKVRRRLNGNDSAPTETQIWSASLPFSTSRDASDSEVTIDLNNNRSLELSTTLVEPRATPPSRTAAKRARNKQSADEREEDEEVESITSPDQNDHNSDDTESVTSVKQRGKRKRWSDDEVDALLKGYKEFNGYPNVWVLIKTKYDDTLRNRSNVDLKDKYRNLVKYRKV